MWINLSIQDGYPRFERIYWEIDFQICFSVYHKSRNNSILYFISLHYAMYRNTKLVDWCQSCTRGVTLTNPKRPSDFFRNNNPSQIIYSTNYSSCFHIFYSFSLLQNVPKTQCLCGFSGFIDLLKSHLDQANFTPFFVCPSWT